jgi:hypothetical protein
VYICSGYTTVFTVLANGKAHRFFLCLLPNTQKTMSKQNNNSNDSSVTDEEKKQEFREYLEILGDRIEVLECLEQNAYFFPDWTIKINEALLAYIEKYQKLNISCEGEKEILTNMNFFFTRIAFHSGLISKWRRETENSKEETEKMMEKLIL